MINQKQYRQIKEKYGQCSSWAVWEDDRYDLNGHGYYLNSIVKKLNQDLSDEEIESLGLHAKSVLIALNFGQRDESKEEAFHKLQAHLDQVAFASFHEELDIHRYSGDRRQKLAYKDTSLWGSYMTDLIKYNYKGEIEAFEESDSGAERLNELLKDKVFQDVQVAGLLMELRILEVDSPTLYAVGSKTYQVLKPYRSLLKKELGAQTEIVQLPHYSRANAISDEVYVQKVHERILEKEVL